MNDKRRITPATKSVQHSTGRKIRILRKAANNLNRFPLSNRRAAPTDHLMTTSGSGKRCAIVGNAQSIFQQNNGSQIDTFDVVCRINTDTIVDPIHQGTKTHLIFVHNMTECKVRRPARPTFTVININKHASDLLDYWSDLIRHELNHEHARPSTGLIAIAFMKRLQYDITLFGFDWYATPTYYTNAYAWKNHFPQWEKQQISTMLHLQNITETNNATS